MIDVTRLKPWNGFRPIVPGDRLRPKWISDESCLIKFKKSCLNGASNGLGSSSRKQNKLLQVCHQRSTYLKLNVLKRTGNLVATLKIGNETSSQQFCIWSSSKRHLGAITALAGVKLCWQQQRQSADGCSIQLSCSLHVLRMFFSHGTSGIHTSSSSSSSSFMAIFSYSVRWYQRASNPLYNQLFIVEQQTNHLHHKSLVTTVRHSTELEKMTPSVFPDRTSTMGNAITLHLFFFFSFFFLFSFDMSVIIEDRQWLTD